MVHVIRNKKTSAEIERFTDLSERGFRGLMMKLNQRRFKVDIYASPESADKATAELKALLPRRPKAAVVLILALLALGAQVRASSRTAAIAGAVAFGVQGYTQLVGVNEVARPLSHSSKFNFNYANAWRVMAPAAIGLAIGQWVARSEQDGDGLAADALAGLAGSQFALTFKW
jgi:hypothetical protein